MNRKRFISYLKYNNLKVIDHGNDMFIGTNDSAEVTNVGIIYNINTKFVYVEQFRDIPLDTLLRICNIINSYNNVSGFFEEISEPKQQSKISKIFHKNYKLDEYEMDFEEYISNHFNNNYRESKVKLINGIFMDIRELSLKPRVKAIIEKDCELDDRTKKIYTELINRKCK